jgi:hypothetical protein
VATCGHGLPPQSSLYCGVLLVCHVAAQPAWWCRWLLLPPSLTHLAKCSLHKTLAPSLDPSQVPDWQRRYPRLNEAFSSSLEVIQKANCALFVPSGWHHCVENLQDTASINHNFINRFSLQAACELLEETFFRARSLLSDCRCVSMRPRLLIQNSISMCTTA